MSDETDRLFLKGFAEEVEELLGEDDGPQFEVYDGDESRVVIYWVDPNQGNVSTPFAYSLARNCANMGQRVMGIIRLGGSHQIDMRNSAIKSFLEIPDKPEWLISWDTDMELIEATALRDLIDHAEEYEARIATCLGFMQRPDMIMNRPDLEGLTPWMPSPHLMFLDEDSGHYWMDLNYEKDVPQWCDATGMGFTLMHRTLLEEMQDDEHPWHEIVDGYGHDVYFSHKAGKLGSKVLYCADIKSRHWKAFGLDEQMFDRAWEGLEKPTVEMAMLGQEQGPGI